MIDARVRAFSGDPLTVKAAAIEQMIPTAEIINGNITQLRFATMLPSFRNWKPTAPRIMVETIAPT